jgi:hypothetical protein
VPAFAGLNNGYLLSLNDSGPNGGGAYINQFTILADILVPGPLNWTPIFNTNPGNGNDADLYIGNDGSIGITTGGYSAAGVITSNTWNRIAFVANLSTNGMYVYVNGAFVKQVPGSGLLDGRWSLYSNVDTGGDLLLFNEGDTSGQYTHELYVNSVALIDRPLTPVELATLGGPKAGGIFVPELKIARNPSSVTITWSGLPGSRLQRSPSLSPITWQPIEGTEATNSFTEGTSNAGAFYRVVTP